MKDVVQKVEVQAEAVAEAEVVVHREEMIDEVLIEEEEVMIDEAPKEKEATIDEVLKEERVHMSEDEVLIEGDMREDHQAREEVQIEEEVTIEVQIEGVIPMIEEQRVPIEEMEEGQIIIMIGVAQREDNKVLEEENLKINEEKSLIDTIQQD